MPIKQKTDNDYVMENTQIKQNQSLEPRPYVPVIKYPQNPVIEVTKPKNPLKINLLKWVLDLRLSMD